MTPQLGTQRLRLGFPYLYRLGRMSAWRILACCLSWFPQSPLLMRRQAEFSNQHPRRGSKKRVRVELCDSSTHQSIPRYQRIVLRHILRMFSAELIQLFGPLQLRWYFKHPGMGIWTSSRVIQAGFASTLRFSIKLIRGKTTAYSLGVITNHRQYLADKGKAETCPCPIRS